MENSIKEVLAVGDVEEHDNATIDYIVKEFHCAYLRGIWNWSCGYVCAWLSGAAEIY
jgi:hypothetical protein